MGNQKSPKQLAKFLSYILGRRPDEFGLIPDKEGYIKIKDLIKAINEEEGWRHVRRALIEEVFITIPEPPIEIKTDNVRAANRENLSEMTPAINPPNILFTCVSEKSYPFVLEKGVFPTSHPEVILSSNKDMAERIGRRKGKSHVLLNVNTIRAIDNGVFFHQSGELIYLAGFLPVGSFTGPLLPKQKPVLKKKNEADAKEKYKKQITAGTFELKIQNDDNKNGGKYKKGGEQSWKRDKKRIRKERKQNWPE